MNVGPVIQRELRVQARSPVTWRLRMLAVALAIGCFGLQTGDARGYHRYMGQVLFATLHGFTIFGILITCPLLSSDTISREKREGTLPLLILSSLTSREIVWGKAAAHALRAYLLWLAAVPVLCLPLLLGGVPVGNVMLTLCIEAALIAIGLSSGLMASAMSERPGMAMLAAYGILAMTGFIAFFVTPLAAALLSAMPGEVGLILASVVIVGAAAAAVSLHVASASVEVGDYGKRWSTGNAPAFVPPSSPVVVARDNSITPEAGARPPRQLKVASSTETRFNRNLRQRRTQLLEKRPIEWLFCRGHGESSREYFAFIWMLFVGYFAFMTLLSSGNPEWIMVPLLMAMTIAAARNLYEERQNGMLELLFIMPALGDQLARAQVGRCWRVFLPPLTLCTGCTWLYALYYQTVLITPLLLIGFTSLFVLPVTGLWLALTTRHSFVVFAGTALLAWACPVLAAGAAEFVAGDRFRLNGPDVVWTLPAFAYVGAHLAVGVMSWFLVVRACRQYPEALAYNT